MEDWYYEPGEGYGPKPVDMAQENIEHGAGQKDLWGKAIEPLPEKHVIMYDGEPVMHNDLSSYYAKKSVPNEEGHAVFNDENDAYDAFREDVIQSDEEHARDEAYRDWRNENPVENYLDDAKSEVGYVYEDPDAVWARGGQAREAFNQGTHDVFDENGDLIDDVNDIHELDDYQMLPVEGEPVPRLPAGQVPPGMPPPPGAGPAKFENYSTPGGQNYREVLMTTPTSMQDYNKFTDSLRAKYGEGGFDNLPLTETERAKLTALQEKGENPSFTGGHWDQPNVLAHIRLKDYADPTTGKKTLLVDEIQSDWHQQGRRKGYGQTRPTIDTETGDAQIEIINRELRNLSNEMDRARAANDNVRLNNLRTDYDSRMVQRNVIREKMEGTHGVPDAPFKKNWQELAFKRALKEAVDGGYDEMAWTTGEQQADRYSLAKQVNAIEVNNLAPAPEGGFGKGAEPVKEVEIQLNGGGNIFLGVDKDGIVKNTSRHQNELSGKSLDEIIGKEMAQKVMSGTGTISGEGLKIGGEGMKGFYDDMLPSFANKYLKKYGVKVEDGPLQTPEQYTGRLRYQLNDARGQPYDAFETRQAAEQARFDAQSRGDPLGTITDLAESGANQKQTVHKISLTPEMKADLLGKGQPMWQVPAAIGAGAAGAAAGAQRDQQQYAKGGIVQEDNMPFQSQAQRGFMYAKHPKIAKRFEEETPKDAKLPEHVKKMSQGGVAGDWKDDLAGYMDQHFGEKRVQYMFDGDIAGNPAGNYDIELGDSSTARGIPYAQSLPPMPAMSASPGPVQGPAFNPKAGLPPSPPPSTPAAPVGSPSSPIGPDPMLQNYLADQRSQLNRYGPEEQMALEQAIQKQRTGFLPNLANAGAGFADAIMQGVARAGPSNFQSNLQNRIDKTQEGQREAMKTAQTGNLARMKQEMELAQIDPSTPISRMAQRSASPLLKRVGLSDDEIRNMPASLIGEAQTRQLSLEEIRAKMDETKALREQTHEFQMGELGLKRDTLAATEANQRAEQRTKQATLREEAAKGLQGRPYYQKAIEIFPWFRSAATKEQMSQIESNPDNHEALDWLQKNANDPRAPDILKKLLRQ